MHTNSPTGATGDAAAVTRHAFAFDPKWRRLLALIGVRTDTAWLELGEERLVARFGPWMVSTGLDNVTGCEVSGPFSALKTIGPHLSFADRGLTFGTNAERAVCIRFEEPVAGMDPLGLIRHPGLTLTVADPEAVAARLNDLRDG